MDDMLKLIVNCDTKKGKNMESRPDIWIVQVREKSGAR